MMNPSQEQIYSMLHFLMADMRKPFTIQVSERNVLKKPIRLELWRTAPCQVVFHVVLWCKQMHPWLLYHQEFRQPLTKYNRSLAVGFIFSRKTIFWVMFGLLRPLFQQCVQPGPVSTGPVGGEAHAQRTSDPKWWFSQWVLWEWPHFSIFQCLDLGERFWFMQFIFSRDWYLHYFVDDRHSQIPIELPFWVGPAVFCGTANTLVPWETRDDSWSRDGLFWI